MSSGRSVRNACPIDRRYSLAQRPVINGREYRTAYAVVTRRMFLTLIGGSVAAAAAAAVGIRVRIEAERDNRYPTIRYGSERCATCRMIITDPRFAAARRAGLRSEEHFDDIVCMVNTIDPRDAATGARFFVHDYEDRSWLDAGAATYVVAATIQTPMLSGLAAYAHAQTAQLVAIQQSGLSDDWGDLLADLSQRR